MKPIAFLLLASSLSSGAAIVACDSGNAAAPDTQLQIDAGTPSDGAASVDDASASTDNGLKFSLCPGAYSGACTTVSMPLDWQEPSGAQIPILINKIAVSGTKPKRQLWLLQGGPGVSSASLGLFGVEIAKRIPDTEIFAIEHRGVGGSNRLSCPVFEAAHPKAIIPSFAEDGGVIGMDDFVDGGPCLEEVKSKYGAAQLAHYTTTNAARDLVKAIALTKRPGMPVFVHGASYGTYWAQRFLQVAGQDSAAAAAAAAAVAGVILDSIVPMSGQSLSQFDLQGDSAAQKIAELCKTNATCSGALGTDPLARLQSIKQKLAAGHCPESGLTPRRRMRFTQMLQIRPLIGYAFALWHRFDRCTPADAAAIRSFLSKNLLPDANEALASTGLYSNIAFSELWESPAPSTASLKDRFDTAIFPAGVVDIAPAQSTWPRYTDPLAGTYATTTTPMLMLAGELDAQTPIATQLLVKAHYAAPNQTFVTFPLGSHGIVGGSPIQSIPPAPQPEDCGFNLLGAFLINPTAALDTSCATKLAGIEWKRPKDEVDFVLGTSDLWLGAPSFEGRSASGPKLELPFGQRPFSFPLLH